jgi:predicted porin
VDGTRDDMGLMFDYYLSVHTNVYVEGDYNRLRDTWMAVGSAASYANYDPTNGPFYAGYPARSQLMVGMRHRF